jgi:23S rRNA pseudouridine1911/1915/1917 synthase
MRDSSEREVFVRGAASQRLDRAIAAGLADLSRGEARRRIAAGSVFVNGRRCRVASKEVREGDRIRVSEAAPVAVSRDLPILFEDEDLIVIDKPAGVPAAPTRSMSAGTASELLRVQLRRRGNAATRIWPVHRLDTPTSGAMMFALTRAAAAVLSESFRQQGVSKTYLALVGGVLEQDSGRIEQAILSSGGRARVSPAGKAAVTEWKLLDRRSEETLLVLVPLTGRMHQLRVHLSAIGHPIVGDRAYGGKPAGRMMLHASLLRFSHPVSGVMQEVRAPTPPELEERRRSRDGQRSVQGEIDQ